MPVNYDFDNRATQVFNAMAPRVVLQDGSLGYRIQAIANFDMTLNVNFDDRDSIHEQISMTTDEAQVRIDDPTVLYDGTMRVNLEILSFTLSGQSTALFGAPVTLRMRCGRFSDALHRPTYGYIDVPLGVTFGVQPVTVTHKVYVTVDTPNGILINYEPALMQGSITTLPPIGATYQQIGNVVLYNTAGVPVAAKATQTSQLTANLDAPNGNPNGNLNM
ncbi:MAG: hypothetical protein JST22_05430 [Bacteroidetes bacterium]|nr:hypothetical protein [Bacteroidota bacterium]